MNMKQTEAIARGRQILEGAGATLSDMLDAIGLIVHAFDPPAPKEATHAWTGHCTHADTKYLQQSRDDYAANICATCGVVLDAGYGVQPRPDVPKGPRFAIAPTNARLVTDTHTMTDYPISGPLPRKICECAGPSEAQDICDALNVSSDKLSW